ncbi:unnamed protein product [Closterium sp. Yama58-4]|nr:unnamed protein product [Closterium sp. Yama58-4]
MASSLPSASESLVDELPPVSPTAAIKAAVVRITAAATGGAVLGGALGFGLGFVAREGTKVAMRESAFGLKTVAIMSAVYAATSAAIENLRNDLLDSAKPGLAGCAAGLAASVPGPPMAMLQGCAAFGLLSFVLDFFAPAEASAISVPSICCCINSPPPPFPPCPFSVCIPRADFPRAFPAPISRAHSPHPRRALALPPLSVPSAEALLRVRATLQLSQESALPSWSDATSPCDGGWESDVRCDPDTNQVVHLDISSLQLSGPIPGADLAHLSYLTYLNLKMNNFSGQLPESLGALTNLVALNVGNNQLTGEIPATYSALSQIVYFKASRNKLDGALPDWFGSWPRLMDLSVPSLALSCPRSPSLALTPAPHPLPALPHPLYYLPPIHSRPCVSEALLMPRTASSFSLLLSLRARELFKNGFTGSIPESLGNVQSLVALSLDENALSGSLPASLGLLPRLEALYVVSNNLQGPIPESFRGMQSLKYIDLSFNLQLSGSLPDFFGAMPSLESIALESCGFTGPIPPTLASLPNLRELFLDHNSLHGALPPSLATLSALTALYLNSNQLSGAIPEDLCGLGSLGVLMLGHNDLEGGIPACLLALPNITTLDLSSNRLSGSVPPVPPASSIDFRVGGNCLEGAPQQLSPCPTGTSPLVSHLLIFPCPQSVPYLHPITYTPLPSLFPPVPVTENGLSKRATKNLTTLYGKGSFGTVYLAQDFLLDHANPHVIIKRAHDPEKMSEEQFKEKVDELARARHRCLVALLGYCMGKTERMLVFEYMPYGTLFDRLHRSNLDPMPWDARVRVAVNVASALAYLHHGVDPPLTHRAVTSSNVLLGADMTAKLSDYGLARGCAAQAADDLARRRRAHRSSRSRGTSIGSTGQLDSLRGGTSPGSSARSSTVGSSGSDLLGGVGGRSFGSGRRRGGGGESGSDTDGENAVLSRESTPHLAREREPMLSRENRITSMDERKADVYGFGVVLLELITGQKAMQDVHITSLAAPFLEDDQMMPLMADSALAGYFNQDELVSLASIARDCVHQAPSQRPSMLDVLRALEDTVDEDLLSSLQGPSTRLLSPGSTASGITSTSNGDRYSALATDGAFDDAAGGVAMGGGAGMGGGGAGKRSAGSSLIDVISASFRRRGGGEKGGGREEGMQRGSGQGPPSLNLSGRSDASDIESSSLLYITPKGH